MFSLVLATARRIAELADWTRRGEWTRTVGEAQFGVDVHHKTLGIVGLGRIGSAVAKRAALGFGMDVIYSNRSRNPEAEERTARNGVRCRNCSRLRISSACWCRFPPPPSD